MQIEIYVTDDDPEFRNILAKALEKTSHKFFLCENSEELIDALSTSNGPAIVFLDIHMEGQDGISTIERLRSVSRRFRLRFITGGDTPTAVAASMIAKARDIDVGRTLFKPFPLEQFSKALEEDINLLMSQAKS